MSRERRGETFPSRNRVCQMPQNRLSVLFWISLLLTHINIATLHQPGRKRRLYLVHQSSTMQLRFPFRCWKLSVLPDGGHRRSCLRFCRRGRHSVLCFRRVETWDQAFSWAVSSGFSRRFQISAISRKFAGRGPPYFAENSAFWPWIARKPALSLDLPETNFSRTTGLD